MGDADGNILQCRVQHQAIKFDEKLKTEFSHALIDSDSEDEEMKQE